MKKQYLSFNDYINEDRDENIFNYRIEKQNKKKDEIYGILAIEKDEIQNNLPESYNFLNSIENLVASINNNSRAIKRHQSALRDDENKMNQMFEQIFDKLDESKTRYVETKNMILTLSKVGEGKTTIDYKNACSMLQDILKDSIDIQKKIEAAIEDAKVVTIDYEKVMNTLQQELPDNEDIKRTLRDNTKIGAPRKPSFGAKDKYAKSKFIKRNIGNDFDTEVDSVETADDERVSEGLLSRIKDSGLNLLSKAKISLNNILNSVNLLLLGIDRKLNRLQNLLSNI